ncbi:8637_t:CDS:10 [Diversispora eburnea]|uniref:Protein OS-9 homolog n=1 Tax=Diversispora eburnea TaxID=1213867 RepID=A0A9N8V6B0_9GLOM|nr:8637_t:CDS:10 [Diversispora eburnea]
MDQQTHSFKVIIADSRECKRLYLTLNSSEIPSFKRFKYGVLDLFGRIRNDEQGEIRHIMYNDGDNSEPEFDAFLQLQNSTRETILITVSIVYKPSPKLNYRLTFVLFLLISLENYVLDNVQSGNEMTFSVSKENFNDPEMTKPTSIIMRTASGQPYLCQIPFVNQSEPDEKSEEKIDHSILLKKGLELLEPMKSQCLHYINGWWTYEYCHLKHVRQYHSVQQSELVVAEGPIFLLGKYDPSVATLPSSNKGHNTGNKEGTDLQVGSGKKYLVQRWGQGTKCDLTGRPRKVEIEFHCVPQTRDSIAMVKEIHTCHYLVVIHTPRLCNDPAFHSKTSYNAHPIECRPIVSDEQYERKRKSLESGSREEEASKNDNEKVDETNNKLSFKNNKDEVKKREKLKTINNDDSEGTSNSEDVEQERCVRALSLSEGTLILNLTKDTYEQLGLTGKPSKYGTNRQRFVVQINLLEKSMIPGKKSYERVKWCFENSLTESFPFLISFIDIISHESKEMNFPSTFNAKKLKIYDWLGMVSLKSQRLLAHDRIDPYISVYSPPEPYKMGDGTLLRWTGFIPSAIILSIFKSVLEQIEKNHLNVPWIVINIYGFKDSPISWNKQEHNHFMSGENNYSFLIWPDGTYTLYQALGEYDTYSI